MVTQDLGKTSVGMQANLAAMLSYLFGFVTGLIFFLIEKDNKFVRFHAMQSIVTFGFLFAFQLVCGFIPIIGWALIPIVSILSLVLWIVLIIKSYQGEKFKLPFAGDIAEQNS